MVNTQSVVPNPYFNPEKWTTVYVFIDGRSVPTLKCFLKIFKNATDVELSHWNLKPK
jgi:hypothetical protein